MAAGPRVLFVADAGPAVGGGHVMRCLTLAAALQVRGGACAFLAAPAVADLLDRFAPPGIARVETAAEADLLVFDHYGLAAPDHRALAAGRPTVVVDDLADRALAADLVVDVGQNRRAGDYAGLVPRAARLLIGPRYALVRREFAAARPASLARRKTGGPVERALVSMGLTDVGGITARAAAAVREALPGCALDVVVGEGAPSRPALAALAGSGAPVRLLADVHDMAVLMSEADLAVGAGGGTGWERCTLGLPSLTAVLAENQAASAEAMAAAGATIALDAREPGFEGALRRSLARLAGDPVLRQNLSRASAGICDGEGAPRVAEACLALLQ